MTKDRLIILLLFLLINSLGLYSQNNPISKDKAIEIALTNGLPIGLSEYDAELQGDTMWVVKSLLCDYGDGQNYETVSVNSLNGNVITDTHTSYFTMHSSYGEQVERTVINANNINFDSLPIVKSSENRKLTTLNENESNPTFSDNDKLIAFQYGFRKIGIISVQGEQFQQICDECLYPQWLDNDWIVYFKDFEHIYKQNINSGEVVKITDKPYRYDNYQLSPDKKWIIYQSGEMWPTQDSLGNPIFRMSINGQGRNLCMISVNKKIKKYFDKDWKYYYKPTWTPNSDSVFFYISAKKYLATDFSTEIIKFSETNLLQNLSLWEYEKIRNGSFPFSHNCQILEINAKTLIPIRFLIKERGRYRDLNFSNNKKYLVYSKTNKKHGDYSLWIMKIK
jgi:Tol biopolymer transport system component